MKLRKASKLYANYCLLILRFSIFIFHVHIINCVCSIVYSAGSTYPGLKWIIYNWKLRNYIYTINIVFNDNILLLTIEIWHYHVHINLYINQNCTIQSRLFYGNFVVLNKIYLLANDSFKNFWPMSHDTGVNETVLFEHGREVLFFLIFT